MMLVERMMMTITPPVLGCEAFPHARSQDHHHFHLQQADNTTSGGGRRDMRQGHNHRCLEYKMEAEHPPRRRYYYYYHHDDAARTRGPPPPHLSSITPQHLLLPIVLVL